MALLASLRCQEDFSPLTVQDWQHAGMMADLVGHDAFSGSGSSLKSQKDFFTEDPTSHITPEIYALISEWSLNRTAQKQQQGGNVGDTVNMLEPTRVYRGVVTPPGPPKRFYRTFWRSLVRKAVRHYLDVSSM
jgi:hypothetical protein